MGFRRMNGGDQFSFDPRQAGRLARAAREGRHRRPGVVVRPVEAPAGDPLDPLAGGIEHHRGDQGGGRHADRAGERPTVASPPPNRPLAESQ